MCFRDFAGPLQTLVLEYRCAQLAYEYVLKPMRLLADLAVLLLPLPCPGNPGGYERVAHVLAQKDARELVQPGKVEDSVVEVYRLAGDGFEHQAHRFCAYCFSVHRTDDPRV